MLWLDVDVMEYPPDVIERLLATGKDIVHPHCVRTYGGRTFDLNAWRDRGRVHMDDLRGGPDLVRLDAVGGTMLLVRADAHRNGLVLSRPSPTASGTPWRGTRNPWAAADRRRARHRRSRPDGATTWGISAGDAQSGDPACRRVTRSPGAGESPRARAPRAPGARVAGDPGTVARGSPDARAAAPRGRGRGDHVLDGTGLAGPASRGTASSRRAALRLRQLPGARSRGRRGLDGPSRPVRRPGRGRRGRRGEHRHLDDPVRPGTTRLSRRGDRAGSGPLRRSLPQRRRQWPRRHGSPACRRRSPPAGGTASR